MISIALLQMLAMLGLPVVIIALLVLGIAGRRDPTRPLCGGCAGQLAFVNFDEDAPCPNCGAKPSEKAPRWERRRPWWKALVGGLIGIALLVGSVVGSTLIVRSVSTISGNRAANTNGPTVNAAMATSSGLDARSVEVRWRLDNGMMTIAELKSAMLNNLGTESAPTPSPTQGARNAAALVLERDPDPAFAKRVLVGCFPPLAVWASALQTPNPLVHIDLTGRSNDELLTRVVVVRSITIDGQVTPLGDVVADAREAAGLVPLRLRRFAPGKHELSLELETLLYHSFDAARLRAPDAVPLLESDWPAPLARSKETIRVQIAAPTS